jgi:3-octaprenyl-4-hydroxybenzoate carboxy-lyase
MHCGAGLSNIAYAKIGKQGAGDGKQALAVPLGASTMALPRCAYVFDRDVDIWDNHEIGWATAFRFAPIRDTVIVPALNTMTVDPSIPSTDPPRHDLEDRLRLHHPVRPGLQRGRLRALRRSCRAIRLRTSGR